MNKLRPFYFFLAILVIIGVAAFANMGIANALPLEDAIPVEEPSDKAAEGVDECVVCHSDKERLVSSAKAEEVSESENEGEG